MSRTIQGRNNIYTIGVQYCWNILIQPLDWLTTIRKCPCFVLLLSNTKYLSDDKLKRGWPKRLLLFWFTFPYIDDHVVYILIWDYLSYFSYSLFSLFECKRCNKSWWLIKGVWFKGLYKRTDKQIWSNILLACRYYNHTFTQSEHTRYHTYFDYRFFNNDLSK